MKTETEKDMFEISLPAFLEIANDILQRAIRAGFSDEYLKCCVVRLSEKQNEKELCYELGFPTYPF